MKKIDVRHHLVDALLAVNPDSLRAYMSLDNFVIDDESMTVARSIFGYVFGSESREKPYRMIGDAAVIPISGMLLHRVGFSGWGITGYEYIRSMFDTALHDSSVKGIIFDVNSGGGQVDGAFELADHIFSNRSVKPSIAVVDSHAYSAAYLLASAAGSVTVPATGGTGSIGVVTMHINASEAVKNYGLEITFVHAGKHKVDGNPYEKLSSEVKDRIQTRIDSTYDLFVSAVAKHRNLDEKAVRDTEAMVYGASESVSVGLVDSVLSPKEAISNFVASFNIKQEVRMTGVKKSGAEQVGDAQNITQADLDQARKDGYQAGSKEQSERFMAVLSSENFKGREALGLKMLGNDKLSAEEINDMLSNTPVVVSGKSNAFAQAMNAFAQAMEDTGNPEVGADVQAVAPENSTKRILGHYQLASGRKTA